MNPCSIVPSNQPAHDDDQDGHGAGGVEAVFGLRLLLFTRFSTPQQQHPN